MHINSKHANQTIKHNDQTKTKLSPQGPQWSRHSVAHVRRRGDIRVHSQVGIWKNRKDKEFLSFISVKRKWKSPPNILVTRNPNWSQRSGTGTGCVKGRY